MLLQFLQSCKLTEKEQKVFLKVLSLGSQPASSIARQLELPRNTVRFILDALVERGFLVRTRRASTQYYAAESFDNIDRMLSRRAERAAEELSTQRDTLASARNELLSWTHSGSRPTITFYEGLSGLEKVYEDTLTASKLRSWASYDDLFEVMPEYFKTYFARRAKRGIHMTSIHPDTPKARHGQQNDRIELRTSALVPADRFHFTPEIQVYDNKINITSWKEKLGIIIESKEIADALKAIFDLSFEAAVGYGKVTAPNKKKRKR